ncbi:calcium/sodium antiporter [Treponema sp. R8-4-B8]
MLIIDILLIILGMVLLIKGGDILVDGASSLARRLKISELAIGLTIVAFGTSSPELVVSLSAAIGKHSEIALGNVIGSNNFNLFFILGITGLIAPIAVQKNTVRIEIPFSLLAVIVLFLLANLNFFPDEKNILTRIDGIILLFFFGLFLFYVYKNMKMTTVGVENISVKTLSSVKIALFIIFGLVFLIIGGKIVVNSAVAIAHALNISEKVIGLTVVALGTSLPELVTSITAIVKKSDDIAIGNIIGSNIFNICLILGVSTVINPMEYSLVFNKDIYILGIGTILLLLAMIIGKKKTLDRPEAAILVIIYIGYVIYLIIQNE